MPRWDRRTPVDPARPVMNFGDELLHAMHAEPDPIKKLQLRAQWTATIWGEAQAADVRAFAAELSRRRHIATQGERRLATVVTVQNRGEVFEIGWSELEVAVRMDGAAPATFRCLAQTWMEVRIVPGRVIPIRYDPNAHSSMALDEAALQAEAAALQAGRLFACGQCGAPLEVPIEGGSVTCGYCRRQQHYSS